MKDCLRRTKIVATLGPASSEPEQIEALISAGLNVARLNFSHGSHEQHAEVFARVRAAAEKVGREVAILQDLQGPKIRVGLLSGGSLVLEAGQEVFIAAGEEQTASDVIPTTYEALAGDVTPGDTILMDDGLMRMRVMGVEGERVRCSVEIGGLLKDRKGINLPGVNVSAPALTAKDEADLAFGAKLGVDIVSLSFVRSAEDMRRARELLVAADAGDVPLIAKIEKPEAVGCLGEILDAADGVMVARGDLGVELGPEKVPILQKEIIEQANCRGQLVITATQMLESMIVNAMPTRAEASDVANAVLDQSDAVMLSGETATGAHPLLVVQTMDRIICEVEASERYHRMPQEALELSTTNNAVAHAAISAATHVDARCIVCISGHGGTPKLVSDYRPSIPIYALTRYPRIRHRLAAYWGVVPLAFERAHSVQGNLECIDALLLDQELAERGDTIIITMVVPTESGDHTNCMKIHVVGRDESGS